jgi:hypothetical protein
MLKSFTTYPLKVHISMVTLPLMSLRTVDLAVATVLEAEVRIGAAVTKC